MPMQINVAALFYLFEVEHHILEFYGNSHLLELTDLITNNHRNIAALHWVGLIVKETELHLT